MSPLIIAEGATLSAPRRGRFNRVSYGLFDQCGRPLPFGPVHVSLRAFKAVQSTKPPLSGANLPLLAGPSLYCGVFYHDFGHFLTETLPWLASLPVQQRHDASVRLVFFAPRVGGGEGVFPPWIIWALDRLKIDSSRIEVCDNDCRFDQLLVSASPFKGRFRYRIEAIRALDANFTGPMPNNGKRLYLSRRKMAGGRIALHNAAENAAIFVEHGFELICPEELAFDEQLSLLAGAAVLAGENGSALHWSLLSPHVRQVISLGGRLQFLGLQRGICACRGQRFDVIGGARILTGGRTPKQISPARTAAFLASGALLG